MAKDTPLAVQEEGNAVAFAALHQPRALGTCAGGMRPQATLSVFNRFRFVLQHSWDKARPDEPYSLCLCRVMGMNYRFICKGLIRKIVNILAVQITSLVLCMFAM